MNTITARDEQHLDEGGTLFMALDLGQTRWKLAFTTGLAQSPRTQTIPARDLLRLWTAIDRAKARFGLAATTPVRSCYEAGRDGFWLHRVFVARGIANAVIDSTSIEVNRRARRAKTDRLDACQLVHLLVRASTGDRRGWRAVRVPTEADEDARQLHRELLTVKRDRTRVTNRIKGLLATQGIDLSVRSSFETDLAVVQTGTGQPLAARLRARLAREWEKVELLGQHIRHLEAERREAIQAATTPATAQMQQLVHLRGVGPATAWLYVMELFAWREIRSGRELGALAGLTPTPFASGNSWREQGITKTGNRYVRAVAIELAWGWLRYQPDSALSRWFARRFADGSSRQRRIGIVAVARKLLVALWRFLEQGVLPEGAVLKPMRIR